MADIIATTDLIARKGDIETQPLRITVHCPKPDPDSTSGDYHCYVEFDGLGESTFAYGIDSLQALSLAMVFIKNEIEKILLQGWKIYHPSDSSKQFDVLSVMFPYETQK